MVERYSSGAPWEKKFAYCRALKAGNMIFVSGTTSGVDEKGEVVGKGDGYAQAKKCFEIIEKALIQLGAPKGLQNVVRSRMFVTDISLSEEFGKAHEEAFSLAPPVATMVEIKQLIHKDMLIEIEVEAYIG